MISRSPVLLAALGAAAALLVSAQPSLATPDPDSAPGVVAGATPGAGSIAVPARYAEQRISWQPCFTTVPHGLPAGSDRLQCGTLSAPMDWNRPDSSPSITIAVSRLRPEHGEPKGSVLTNPGGPGGPGRTLPLVFLEKDRRALLDNEEIIGIDVRGTGASTNLDCAGGTDIGGRLDPSDRDRDNLSLLLDSAALTAEFCQDHSGAFGRLVNTEQTVKDLDLLRVLLGREKINWIGYSGGTWLGAYYATYFPQRVGKFVLDSNAVFTAPWQYSFGFQPMGFERRFRADFLPWAAGYDSVYQLGGTADAVLATYERLRAAIKDRPVKYPKAGAVDENALDSTITQALYSREKFPGLAHVLSVVKGLVDDPGQPFDRADAASLGALAGPSDALPKLRPTRSLDASSAVFNAIKCNDTRWTTSKASLVAESGKLGEQYPLVGYGLIGEPCAFWHRPPLRMPRPTGDGVPPVLMVQDTHDPATPYEGAVEAHRDFANSRLLTVRDQGDHGVYAFGNDCVDAEVEHFLLDGTVPPEETSCPGVPLPNPLARESGRGNPLDLVQQYTDTAGQFPR